MCKFVFFLLFVSLSATNVQGQQSAQSVCSNQADGRATIVIAAPQVYGNYMDEWEDIVRFQVSYVERIMSQSQDNVIYLVSRNAMNKRFNGNQRSSTIRNRLPKDVLLETNVLDIWMRDFSPAKMSKQVMFRYYPEYLRQYGNEATREQNSLKSLLRRHNVLSLVTQSNLTAEGGNVVDNEQDKAILTARIFTDNPQMTRQAVINQLKSDLSYQQIAILPDEGDITGHSDGSVSFLDTNVLAINDQGSFRENQAVTRQIQRQFTGTPLQFVVLPSVFPELEYDPHDSACGWHVNLLASDNYLYVPTYGEDPANPQQSTQIDARVLATIRNNTRKQVVPVPMPWRVCRLGGSVRCLSWQVKGQIADTLVRAAQTGGCGRNSGF